MFKNIFLVLLSALIVGFIGWFLIKGKTVDQAGQTGETLTTEFEVVK